VLAAENEDCDAPYAGKFIICTSDPKAFGLDMELALPQPGDLTQCEHCQAMLEYIGNDRTSLSLRRATRERVDSFNRLAQEGSRVPAIPELIEYVRKHRKMPTQAVARIDLEDPRTDSHRSRVPGKTHRSCFPSEAAVVSDKPKIKSASSHAIINLTKAELYALQDYMRKPLTGSKTASSPLKHSDASASHAIGSTSDSCRFDDKEYLDARACFAILGLDESSFNSAITYINDLRTRARIG
jgi:hypothetical protein